MRDFSFQIKKKNNKYFFALYPNNIPYQDIGRSCEFESKELCIKVLSDFRNFVKEHKISNENSQYIQIVRKNIFYYFSYVDGNNTLFYRKKGYWSKNSCIKGICSIWRNIDAVLK